MDGQLHNNAVTVSIDPILYCYIKLLTDMQVPKNAS